MSDKNQNIVLDFNVLEKNEIQIICFVFYQTKQI